MEDELSMYAEVLRGSVDRLAGCLDGLPDEALNCQPPAPEANSIGVVVVHTMGNLEENVLGIACGREVARDRDAEFAAGAQRAPELLERLRDLGRRVEAGLAALPASELSATRRHPRRGDIAVRRALLITARHMAEHAGQIELTRDLAVRALSEER